MFRLLSKETNLFSVPIYMGVLWLMVWLTNTLSLNALNIISNIIAFSGMALSYVLFNRIALNRRTHLPLFLYTILLFCFYERDLDIGISVALFTNAILLFFLTDDQPKLREHSYPLIGAILATSFIFLPSIWCLTLFILLHIIMTSDNIFANILKLLVGQLLVFLGYFCLMYSIGYTEINEDYFPLISQELSSDFSDLYALIPIFAMSILAIFDHFVNFNQKSPASKFKYSFVLAFFAVQSLILIFYMGNNYEYFLLISLPLSMILGRYLRFLKRYWLQELGLWITIFCLIIFKFLNLE